MDFSIVDRRAMGSFYANIAVRTTDLEAVVALLEELERTAYVAHDGKMTMVFDEKCDDQDLDELQRLAAELSRRLRRSALAVCNHDDDVLWYALATAGRVIDIYDSNPGYFEGRREAPRGGDAERLCRAFDVPQERSAVAALLEQSHGEFVVEVDRHESLRVRLGLSEGLSLLGYRYVRNGELAPYAAASTLRSVGAAPPLDGADHANEPSRDVGARNVLDERTRIAIEREGYGIMWESYALALHTAEVPERLVPLFGVRRGNGHLLFTRLARYIVQHKLNSGTAWVRVDDLLAAFLGEREFVIVALARLLRAALGIPPLTDDERAGFQRGDPALLLRLGEAIRVARQSSGDDEG